MDFYTLKWLLLINLLFLVSEAVRFNNLDQLIRMPSGKDVEPEQEQDGKTWAVLVAGSNGFENYRHQADVCHAYQILKRGGLEDENIVVFMYDDIAGNELNPRPGVIINHPQGEDLYAGVPKDYTGEEVTAENLYGVLMGNKNSVKGGSGKVVDSKANDRIFVYYSDHGGPGVLGMPNLPFLYSNDLIEVLKKKHAANSYKTMVIYVEACESGSVFEGIMPTDLNIYVTTASNAEESSWGTYCPGMDLPPSPELITCLGDLYSVAWMEDSETHNLKKETIEQQYESVRKRTLNYNIGSHVMEYGNTSFKPEKLYHYQGFDPATVNLPPNKLPPFDFRNSVVNQRDAELLFLWQQYKTSIDDGLEKRSLILKKITNIMMHRVHLDGSIETIGVLLFGPVKGPDALGSLRGPNLPIVNDWSCLKSMVRVFEMHCGSLTQYGMKHMRAFANICNNGVSKAAMEKACIGACSMKNSAKWHPSTLGGFSA